MRCRRTTPDAASKQPIFKTAAARIRRVAAGNGPAPAPTNTASAPAVELPGAATRVIPTAIAGEDIRTTPGEGLL